MDFENIFWAGINKISGCPRCFHHGFFHSILGATLGSFILSLILWKLKNPLNKLSLKLRIKMRQPFSFKILLFSSFLAWMSHLAFDTLVHRDVFLFWPVKTNPFLISWKLYWPLTYALAVLGVISSIILIIRLKNDQRQSA